MTVRVGVIGTGWWATRAHLPALAVHPDAEIGAIVNRGRANRDRAAERFGVKRAFATVEEMLDAVPLDAAVVATPNDDHARSTRLCLEHGLHVLLEKPMTIEAADAFELVALARRMDRQLIIGYPWHYNRQLLELRDVLRSGRVGPIEAVSCLFASIVRALYKGRPEPYRDVLGYPLNRPRADTYSDPAIAGGGQGLAQVTHAAALLQFLTDLEAIDVSAATADHELRVDLVDALVVRFDGGAIGTLASTGSVLPGQEEILEYRIFGSGGHVCIDVIGGTASVHGPDGTVEPRPVLSLEERYPEAAPVQNLVGVAAGRASNGSPAELGARTVALIEAMYHSAREGARTAVMRPQWS